MQVTIRAVRTTEAVLTCALSHPAERRINVHVPRTCRC